VAAAIVGGIAATWSHIRRCGAETTKRVGAVAAGATMSLGFAVAGSIVFFGMGTVWVVPLLLGLGALLGWRHRRSWTTALAVLVRAKPTAAPPTSPSHVGRPAHGQYSEVIRAAHPIELTPTVPPVLARLSCLDAGAVSTPQLCGAWQRTYWLLLDLPPGPPRDQVVRIRRHVLDELERRDPTGFGRWLESGPRACNHPGQYLGAGDPRSLARSDAGTDTGHARTCDGRM
jgi:hypothetical protein